MVQSAKTGTWYVVTLWTRTDGGVEAHQKRKATDGDFERVNARRSRPNVEKWDGAQRTFVCRECAVEFADSGGLIMDPCPGCGQYVGFISSKREYVRR